MTHETLFGIGVAGLFVTALLVFIISTRGRVRAAAAQGVAVGAFIGWVGVLAAKILPTLAVLGAGALGVFCTLALFAVAFGKQVD